MKGISSLLIATLVVSAYGGSLEKLGWESIEKLRQENELKKEEVLSFLREIVKDVQTTNDKYKQILIDFKNREIENYVKNIETWGPGIPPNIISLIQKYKQNVPKKDQACKKHQNKNQKKDDSDDTKDNEDSDKKDIDGENSDQNKEESSIRSRQRRSDSRTDKDSSDEDDDSNSIDDNSSNKESRRSNSGKGKSKQMNSDESNSDDKSDDSDETNSMDSRKDKRKKKNSDESNSDDKSDDSDSNENKSRGSRIDKSKKKNSDESNSDDKFNDSDSDEKNSGDSRNDKPKQDKSDESNSDDMSDDDDSNKSKKDEDDDSKNSAEVKKWKSILNRGDHQAHNGFPAPWNWNPVFNWELEATRAELKNRLMSLVQLDRVIKLIKNHTEEFIKRGQWERTSGLARAMALHKKLLRENILAVSRICNITEVEQLPIPELIINCMINYSPGWRKLSNVVRAILENNKHILNDNTPLQEFLGAHPNLNQPHIIQPFGAKGHKDKDIVKEGKQQVIDTIPWQSQADKGAPPSDNTGAIEQETSLNSTNSSDKNKNHSLANVDESAVLDKDQAPEPIPTNRKEESAGKNLTDQSGSDSQVPIKNESSSLEPEVSNSSGNKAKAGELDPTSKNEINKGENNENSDSEIGENSTGSNNQISTTADSTSDDTSSQTDSTTIQSEPSSNISENTEHPRSTSALSTEETTNTVQNASSETESIINTTAPRST